MRVLLVEDEILLARAIRNGLHRAGLTVDVVHDGESALESLRSQPYEAVVLDRDLPALSGDEVCRHIITDHPQVGVLMLTASATLAERVDGLSRGADDYLTKPFEFPELVARLRALQRRSGHRAPPQLTCGDVSLDPFTHQAFRAGVPLALSPKEFRVLEQLLRADGGVLSAETLLQKAWDEHADPFTNSPRVVISTLRRKLGRPWPIETVPGVGYRVVAA
ncbi:response regulator transcription factor [Actinoplanes couchii]|uniref:DNA-binding response regulator n=1 Tax=Actinoplanes couchii TaxID=403638 RepID=A0ABQ3XRY4_9ACTN|nr:response regulator transcription factor [Actinoplanes couchii]MDR6318753.1 two-component system response regulator VanR [Actinoplanes couchii]GID61281.1 DNA-binding response regulator [Actinoplanes couchii]